VKGTKLRGEAGEVQRSALASAEELIRALRRVMIGLFRDLFDCDGRRFGGPSLGRIGTSDGMDDVQWNAGYFRSGQTATLGVNLDETIPEGPEMA